MIAIYPLGNGSTIRDLELKASISSLRKYTDVEDIYVTGVKPMQHVDAIYNPVFSLNERKHISSAINILDLLDKLQPDSFLLMNDDFFCNKQTILTEIPMWYDRTILDKVSSLNLSNRYRNVLLNSMVTDYDLNFAVHFPMPIYDTQLFANILDESIHTNQGYSFRNRYGNEVKDKMTIEKKKDCKYNSPEFDKKEILKNDWWSIGDNFITTESIKFISEYYL